MKLSFFLNNLFVSGNSLEDMLDRQQSGDNVYFDPLFQVNRDNLEQGRPRGCIRAITPSPQMDFEFLSFKHRTNSPTPLLLQNRLQIKGG